MKLLDLTEQRQKVKKYLAQCKTDGLEAMTHNQEEDLERSVFHTEQKVDEFKQHFEKER